jgi:hypothetical protein
MTDSRPIMIDPDSLPQWLIARAGDDHKECMACLEPQEDWALVFSKADDSPPVWLCLKCLSAEIRVAAARRARDRRKSPRFA